MYTRVVRVQVKPEKLKEFKQAITEQALPQIRKQSGFIDAIEMYSGTEFCCTTFWRSKEDIDRYDRTLYQQIIAGAKPLVQSDPEVKTYQVENSTVHKIGQAA